MKQALQQLHNFIWLIPPHHPFDQNVKVQLWYTSPRHAPWFEWRDPARLFAASSQPYLCTCSLGQRIQESKSAPYQQTNGVSPPKLWMLEDKQLLQEGLNKRKSESQFLQSSPLLPHWAAAIISSCISGLGTGTSRGAAPPAGESGMAAFSRAGPRFPQGQESGRAKERSSEDLRIQGTGSRFWWQDLRSGITMFRKTHLWHLWERFGEGKL